MRKLASTCVLSTALCLCIAAAASGHDILGPDWRGDLPEYMTYQEWRFDNVDDPADPEVITNPFGGASADITRGFLSEGWFDTLGGYGTQTGFWDIGGQGGSIVIDIDNGPDLNLYKEIWVQVTYWDDIQQAPVVEVPGGCLVDYRPGHLIEDVDTGGDWLLDVWVFRMTPNPCHEQVIITSNPDWGSVIDQVVIDTWCVPEPATMSLVALGALATLLSRLRK